MSRAEDNIMFDILFILLMTAFSSATSSQAQLQFYTSQIFAPWPSAPPQQTLQNCVWYDAICQVKNQATAGGLTFVGSAMLWFVSMVASFLSRVVIFGNLIAFLLFNGAFSANGVPFLPIVFIGLQIYVVLQAFRDFRGSGVGV
jgi:hypothetical protein